MSDADEVGLARAGLPAPTFKPGRHIGLLLDRYWNWRDPESAPEERSTVLARAIHEATRIAPDEVYREAFIRWTDVTKDKDRFSTWHGRLVHRIFLGGGEPSPLETNLRFHHTYGMPLIPGSSSKGAALAIARRWAEGNPERARQMELVFGVAPDGDRDEPGQKGHLVFHDAWWIPDSAAGPLVPEIVTVHHQEYYSSKGGIPATDFDDPVPVQQLACHGAFLFAIEGPDTRWSDWAMSLLKQAATSEGLGAKTSAGYGLFDGNA